MAAFVTVPFLMFVVPRIYFSLHPDPIINTSGKIDMDPRIRIVFTAMLLGFTGLFYWMLSLRVRVARLARARSDVGHDRNLGKGERVSGTVAVLLVALLAWGLLFVYLLPSRAPHRGDREVMNAKVILAVGLLAIASGVRRHAASRSR